MVSELEKLIQLIASRFVFDEKAYPEFQGANDEDRLKFALRHSALHFSKTAGKIAAVIEDVDHGEKMDFEILKIQTVKSLINTLRLAELLNMSGNELIRLIEEKV